MAQEKKKENRDAMAARKKKNNIAEKEKRPNNLLLAILIFGVLFGMFGFLWVHNYIEKEDSIESYIESMGAEEYFKSMAISDTATMALTAEKNDVTIVITDTGEDKKAAEEEYAGEKGTAYVEYIGAYYLKMMKPSTKAFFASADITVKYGKEEINKASVKYWQYNRIEKKYKKLFDIEDEESEE